MLKNLVRQGILAEKAIGIDHIAIAVRDLEASIEFYTETLGFEVREKRETAGRRTAMKSAVIDAGPISLVLVQGTTPESQVSQFIEHYGPGVQHLAIGVKDLKEVARGLKDSGLEFDTTVIEGTGLLQIFSHRDPGSGIMIELIEKTQPDGRFSDESVKELFSQLEASDSF
ncbi:MAG: VOC family protein [Deltaproteobacteria bacterium]|nr:VOC family protein [Deltaproteobacteria bacterium]